MVEAMLVMGSLLLLVVTYAVLMCHKKMQKYAHLPGPGLSFLPKLIKNDPGQLPKLLMELQQKFGDAFCLWLGPNPAIVFTDIYSIRDVQLKSDGEIYKKGFVWESFAPAFGLTTVSLDQKDKWSRNRHMMLKFLTGFTAASSTLLTTTIHQTQLFVDNFKQKGGPTQLDMYHDVQLLMLRILYISGTELEPKDEILEEVLELMDWIFTQTVIRAQSPGPIRNYTPIGSQYVKKANRLKEIARDIIAEVRQKRATRGPFVDGADNINNAKCHVDMLLDWTDDNGNPMTQTELEDEVVGLLTGFDNTSTFVSWLCHLLAHNTWEQKELYNAVINEKLAPTFTPGKGNLEYMDQCSKLWANKYLNGCVKETLRIFPPSPMTARECVKDDVVGDVVVPKGTIVIVVPYAEYMNPQVFPSPQKFDPLRWLSVPGSPMTSPLPSRKVPMRQAIHKEPSIEDNVLFFGAGPRACPGRRYAPMAGKVFISMLLSHFEIHPPADVQDYITTHTTKMALSPPGPVKLRLVPRA